MILLKTLNQIVSESSTSCNGARHFHYRLNVFFQQFLKSTAMPLGNIADYAIRIEFQARGSPHAHCVIWVKDAPKYGIDDDQLVCDFIDQYITCGIPSDEGKLKELVLLLQQHKHSSYCKRHNKCRFTFPKPPSTKTLITQCDVDPDVASNAQTVLSKVYPVLADNHADMSLEDKCVGELTMTSVLSLPSFHLLPLTPTHSLSHAPPPLSLFLSHSHLFLSLPHTSSYPHVSFIHLSSYHSLLPLSSRHHILHRQDSG